MKWTGPRKTPNLSVWGPCGDKRRTWTESGVGGESVLSTAAAAGALPCPPSWGLTCCLPSLLSCKTEVHTARTYMCSSSDTSGYSGVQGWEEGPRTKGFDETLHSSLRDLSSPLTCTFYNVRSQQGRVVPGKTTFRHRYRVVPVTFSRCYHRTEQCLRETLPLPAEQCSLLSMEAKLSDSNLTTSF